MIELIAAAIAAGAFVVASFVSSVGPQLARRFVPSRFDMATMEGVALRRQELEAQESRFLRGLAEARDLKLREFEARRGDIELQMELQRWPLGVLPAALLSRSRSYNGRALNVILKLVEPRDAGFYAEAAQSLGAAIGILDEGPLLSATRAVFAFGNDLTFYHEIRKNVSLSGEGLRTTLWSPLRTEPTVLIEVNIPRADRFVFSVSHWGGAFEPAAPLVALGPLTLDVASLPSDDGSRQVSLALTLSSLIVSLGDTSRAMRRPHELHVPVFPTLMKNATSSGVPSDAWKPMMTAYLSSYDGIAAHSPRIASELAARAALAAQDADQPDFAATLLHKAIALYREATGARTESPEALLAHLIRERTRSDALSQLEQALKRLVGPSPRGAQSASSGADVRDLASRFVQTERDK